jgi:hypothetical protein
LLRGEPAVVVNEFVWLTVNSNNEIKSEKIRLSVWRNVGSRTAGDKKLPILAEELYRRLCKTVILRYAENNPLRPDSTYYLFFVACSEEAKYCASRGGGIGEHDGESCESLGGRRHAGPRG